MDAQKFIQLVAGGEASQAKDMLNDLLSSRAFESLDIKKQEIAQTLYNNGENIEVQDTADSEIEDEELLTQEEFDELSEEDQDLYLEALEQLDELSPSTLDSYARKRTRMLNKAEKEKPGRLNPKIMKAVGARDFTGYSDKEHGRLAGQAVSVNRAKAKSREAKDMEMIKDLQRKNIESGRLKPIKK